MNFKKFDRERSRRQAQKSAAMDSRQRAEMQMRQKAIEQGRKALEDHVRKHVMTIVPAWCRAISEWAPPTVWFTFWGKMTWIALQPGKFARWLIWRIFIRPGIWIQRHVWQWGCYTEIEPIDDRIIQVSIHRWFTCRYRCRFNMFTGIADQEEV